MESWIFPFAAYRRGIPDAWACARLRKRIPRRHAGLLLVANKGEHTLGIIDPVQGEQIATVDEGGITGHEVGGLRPTGGALSFLIYGNSGVGSPGTDGRTVAVIDVATHKLVEYHRPGKTAAPPLRGFWPQNGLLYITTELGNSVTIIDPESLRIRGLGAHRAAGISHAGHQPRRQTRLHVKRGHVGTISVLDLEARQQHRRNSRLAASPAHRAFR
jgi:hypothetical protein